jgi:hypothetical protein
MGTARNSYIAKARTLREAQKLFPISLVSHSLLTRWTCLDPDTGEDLALEIRRYYIPAFTAWNDNAKFNLLFDNLLTALREDKPVRNRRSMQ